jgi:hypothetical protein
MPSGIGLRVADFQDASALKKAIAGIDRYLIGILDLA